MDNSFVYMIREDNKQQYTISKWEDMGAMPIVTYKLSVNPHTKRITCTCPSGRYRNYCHHTDKLREWMRLGKPEGMLFKA